MKIYAMTHGTTKQMPLSTKSAMSWDMFRPAGETISGSDIGLARAYSASVWAYRAVQLRADAIAGIPVVVQNAKGEPVENHPLQAMFSDVTSALLKRIETGICIWGEAYLEIVPNAFGRAAGMNWLNPLAVQMILGNGGIERYLYNPMHGGQGLSYTPDELVHFHTVNPADDLRGLSPMAVALNAVNVDRDTIRYAQSFFSNGARLDGILVVPDANDDQIDAVEAKWKARFRGVKNAFRTLILGSRDVSYTPVVPPPKDVVMAEIKAEQRRDICAAFGVPPALVGAWEASNYATAREQRRSFYTETILPELDFIADELNRQFVSVHFPGVQLAFDTSGVEALREDERTRNAAISVGYTAGWMTQNEARARADLPPVDGGDEFKPSPQPMPQLPAGKAVSEVAAHSPFRSYP